MRIWLESLQIQGLVFENVVDLPLALIAKRLFFVLWLFANTTDNKFKIGVRKRSQEKQNVQWFCYIIIGTHVESSRV